MTFGHEKHDDQSENYILSKIICDATIIERLQEITRLLEKKEAVNLPKKYTFLSTWYKKIGFVDEVSLGDESKHEIYCLMFGKNVKTMNGLPKQMKAYIKNLEGFRSMSIEEKGFVFYLLEAIVEKKLNISDTHYQTLLETVSDQALLYQVIADLCRKALDAIRDNLQTLLKHYQTFADTYFTFDSNYLSDDDTDTLHNTLLELFQYLLAYLIHQDDFEEQTQEIIKRIEAGVVLETK